MTPLENAIRDTPQGATFVVRVQPNAKRTGLLGTVGTGADAAIKIALTAPAVEGRANEALIDYLSGLLNVPRSAVHLIAGAHARNKVIRIPGRSAAELHALLREHLLA